MVGVGVAPLVVVRSILVIILADEEVDSVAAAAAAASFSSAAFVFCYDLPFLTPFVGGELGVEAKKRIFEKKTRKNQKKKAKKIPPKRRRTRELIDSLSLSGETTQKI